jgi:polysaccharide pyruvyl transferase WcaK-like protein
VKRSPVGVLSERGTGCNANLKGGCDLADSQRKRRKVGVFGNFGSSNFGNEVTLEVFLHHLLRLLPDAEVLCICTNPDAIAATYGVAAVAISRAIAKPWSLHSRLVRWFLKVFIGVPSELNRWLDAFRALKRADILFIPGTGLLTDAFGNSSWGPYNVFKWSLMARLRGCKVRFVSVGAGPLDGALGRFLVKSALSLADFRSYRDQSSMKFLEGIGFRGPRDRVYPDLVFSLPDVLPQAGDGKRGNRSVVGLGLMEHGGMYSVAGPDNPTYLAYLETLAVLVRWLLTNEYDIRLLFGDGSDRTVIEEFKSLLSRRLGTYDEARITAQPISSAHDLFSELAATDMVVATRFHNILSSLILNKPVIAISFHHKCASLMGEMGLSEYCLDIEHLDAERLIESFRLLERNADALRSTIGRQVSRLREAVDAQYDLIIK